jgi:hypothetical protein
MCMAAISSYGSLKMKWLLRAVKITSATAVMSTLASLTPAVTP